MQCRRDRLLGVLHNLSENTVGENHYWNILYYMKIKGADNQWKG